MVREAAGMASACGHLVAGAADASVVYEDDQLLAFCDVNPVNPGHVLIIPKVHGVELADLDESDRQSDVHGSTPARREQPRHNHTAVPQHSSTYPEVAGHRPASAV
jgi:diadenosine tetraphosphate (Ap4A) HIT family hydrolase